MPLISDEELDRLTRPPPAKRMLLFFVAGIVGVQLLFWVLEKL